MIILLTFLFAYLLYQVSSRISQKTTIPILVIYLIIGIVFGISDLLGLLLSVFNLDFSFNLFANDLTTPILGTFSSKIALTILFVSAGIGIELKQIKSSGKIFLKLATLPAFFEGLIAGIVLFILIMIVPGHFRGSLSLIDSIIITLFLSMSTASVVLPAAQKNIKAHYLGSKNINTLMSGVSFFDGYAVYFLIVLIVIVSHTIAAPGPVSLIPLLNNILVILLPIILAAIISFGFGLLVGLIIKKIKVNYQLKVVLTLVLAILFLPLVTILPNAINGLNAFALGIGINLLYHQAKDYLDLKYYANQMLLYFGFPIIFLAIASTIDIQKLLSPSVLFIAIITLIVGILVKGFVAAKVLAKAGYEKVDQKFTALCFAAKGNGAVNFGLVMMYDALTNLKMSNILDFLQYIAVIYILISIPITIILLAKYSPKLNYNLEKDEDI